MRSGTGTNYSFTLGASVTNLSLVVSNSSAAYSYLLLAKGRAPTDTDFDFSARINGVTNQINLQAPEFVATNYGLRVLTPATSTTHSFTVNLTTNRTDLRQPGYPVWKPQSFTTTGVITNAGDPEHFIIFRWSTDQPSRLADCIEHDKRKCRPLRAPRHPADDGRLFESQLGAAGGYGHSRQHGSNQQYVFHRGLSPGGRCHQFGIRADG